MYISEHPLSELGHLIEPCRSVKLTEIETDKEGEFVRVAGIITTLQSILTRQNQKMIFAKIEDLEEKVEIIVFPKLLQTTNEIWTNDKVVAVDGFVSYKDGSPKILAEAVYELHEKSEIPKFERRTKKKYGVNGFSKNNKNENVPTPADLPPEKIKITVQEGSNRSILMEIKEILSEYKGKSAVTIRIPNNKDEYREVALKDKVEISPVFLRKLQDIVGKKNVVSC
jgi:DNA polymerase III alpha subunit